MSNFTIKYHSTFANQKGETWHVEILTTEPDTIQPTELKLDADDPLTIEWDDREKHEPLQGATLTLKAETPTDRAFTSFITADPLQVIIKAYRNNNLFWQGSLDAEDYEEPYQRSAGYLVTLTFTDFGQWKRIPFNLHGVLPISQVITHCLQTINLPTSTLQTLISLQTAADPGLNQPSTWTQQTDLSTICIDTSNLYDDTATPQKMYDAIEALLQPLALRIMQRDGHTTIYDLNTIYKTSHPQPIQWDADTQTLQTDKQRQSLKIRFTPNGKPTLINYDITDHLTTSDYNNSIVVWYENPTTAAIINDNIQSFAFAYTKDRQTSNFIGLQYLNPRAQPFKISSYQGNAQDATGIAWMAMLYKYGDTSYNGQSIDNRFNGIYATAEAPILMQLPDVWCPAYSGYYTTDPNAQDLSQYLRLKLSVLFDTRYNPFEDPSKADQQPKTDWDYICGVVYVPYSLVLYDKDGTPIYQLISTAKKEEDTTSTATRRKYTYAKEWQKITNPSIFTPDYCFLAYYKDTHRTDVFDGKALSDGWTTNKDRSRLWSFATDRPTDSTYPKRYLKEGERIPLPPIAGSLRLTIYCGFYVNRVTYADGYEDPAYYPTREKMMNKQDERTTSNFNWLLRFMLYKIPELDIVTGAAAATDETDPTEYKALIPNTSIEELSIDTTFGTDVTLTPMQKGTYRTTTNHRLLLRRTNTTAPYTIETDLLYTLCSQYATRSLTLKGECITPTQTPTPTPFTERAQPQSRLFIPKTEVLEALKGTSTITFTELKEEIPHPEYLQK